MPDEYPENPEGPPAEAAGPPAWRHLPIRASDPSPTNCARRSAPVRERRRQLRRREAGR